MDFIKEAPRNSYDEIHGLDGLKSEVLFTEIHSNLLENTDFERLKYSPTYSHSVYYFLYPNMPGCMLPIRISKI